MLGFPLIPTHVRMESFGKPSTTLHTARRHKIIQAPHYLPLLPSLAATTDQESAREPR